MSERVTQEQVENDTNWLRCRDKQSRMIANRYERLAADRDGQASERSRYESLYTRADEAYRDAIARAERAERERDDLKLDFDTAMTELQRKCKLLAAANAKCERLRKVEDHARDFVAAIEDEAVKVESVMVSDGFNQWPWFEEWIARTKAALAASEKKEGGA